MSFIIYGNDSISLLSLSSVLLAVLLLLAQRASLSAPVRNTCQGSQNTSKQSNLGAF